MRRAGFDCSVPSLDVSRARRLWQFCVTFGWFGYVAVATPGISAAAPAQNWEQVLTAANSEGTIIAFMTGGQIVRQALMTFQTKFPQIRLELIGGTEGKDIISRITAERKADRYLWDIYIAGPGSLTLSLKPAGFLDPVKDALLLPEVLDDRKWFAGLNDGWKDKEKKYAYGFQGDVSDNVWVNRDFIPEDKLKSIDQLIEPEWKGKIAWRDPTAGLGAGASHAGYILAARGEKFLRDFLANTGSFAHDQRQVAEWIIRGRYPIVVALTSPALEQFWQAGVGKNVKPLDWASADVPARVSAGTGVMGLINKAPHPNALRVFANWLLSKEGQEAWVKNTKRNSRRLDVSKVPETAPQPGRKYIDINVEDLLRFQKTASEIAKEILK
jgi:iron(III) transport system substrate-binding protein